MTGSETRRRSGAGDAASRAAYERAATTFASRRGMIGEPVLEADGYAGFLDMGAYYLVMSDDGTGTKIDLATELGQFATLGFDLLAMVADDAVCIGAEVISVTNCLDVPRIDPAMVDALMAGLAEACRRERVVVPAGEIAEVPGAVSRGVWSATALGIVAKDRVIRPERVQAGDVVLSLGAGVARSNGFSLIRRILADRFGPGWAREEWRSGIGWGEVMLTPSIVYHSAVLSLVGRYGAERLVDVRGIAHVTGGGLPSKLRRVLKRSGLGASLDDPWEPHPALVDLISMGGVPIEEAYRTWCMGNGMLVIVPPAEAERALGLLGRTRVRARRAGVVTVDPAIEIRAWEGSGLRFDPVV